MRQRERENGSRWCVSSRRSLTEGCRREGRGGKGRKGFGGRRRGALHRPRTQLCIGTAPSFPSPAPLRQPSSPTERTPSPRPGPRATTDRIDHRHGGRGGRGMLRCERDPQNVARRRVHTPAIPRHTAVYPSTWPHRRLMNRERPLYPSRRGGETSPAAQLGRPSLSLKTVRRVWIDRAPPLSLSRRREGSTNPRIHTPNPPFVASWCNASSLVAAIDFLLASSSSTVYIYIYMYVSACFFACSIARIPSFLSSTALSFSCFLLAKRRIFRIARVSRKERRMEWKGAKVYWLEREIGRRGLRRG